MEKSLKKQISSMAFIYCILHIIIFASEKIFSLMVNSGFMGLKADDINWGTASIILSTVPLYAIGFPTACMLFKKLPSFEDDRKKETITLSKLFDYFIVCYSFIFTGGLAASFAENFISNIFGRQVMDPSAMLIMSDVPKALLFTATVIAAPIGEELLFRFLPYKKLCGFGIVPYVAITSLFFALFHMNISQGIYTFMASIIFSYVYFKTGRIIYSILLHMMINFIGSVIAPYVSGNEKLSIIFSITIIVISAMGIFNAVSFLIKESLKEKNTDAQHLSFSQLINPGLLCFAALFIFETVRGILNMPSY